MRMWVYIVRRAVLVLPVVIGVLTVLFVLVSSLSTVVRVCSYGPPSGTQTPCTSTVPCPADPSQLCPNPVYQSAVNSLGLNQPIFVQWAIFVGNALTFQWGYVSQSSTLGTGLGGLGLPALHEQTVTSVLAIFLPYTIELVLFAFLITLLVVFPILRRATAHPGHAADHTARVLTLLGYGIPLVFLGSFALFGAANALGGASSASPICPRDSTFLDFFGSWPQPPCAPLYGTANLNPVGFPSWLVGGYHSTPTGFPTVDAVLNGNGWLALDTLLRMAVPALLLAFVAIAAVLRSVRFTSPRPVDLGFLRAARARGLPESRVLTRHTSRYTISQILSSYWAALFMVLAFLPLVESVFNLWGVGRLYVYAIVGRPQDWDFGIIFGTLLAGALIVLLVSFTLDVLRAYADPRFRLEGEGTVTRFPRGSPDLSTPVRSVVGVEEAATPAEKAIFQPRLAR